VSVDGLAEENEARVADARDAALRSFKSAVAVERKAILSHERAAFLHQDRARRLRDRADGEVSEARRQEQLNQALFEDDRAAAARARAAGARKRLIDEGESPD
jgi:hypothetical protein